MQICLFGFVDAKQLVRTKRGVSYISTENVDDPNEFRSLRYNSDVRLVCEEGPLERLADYNDTFNDKNVFMNRCITSKKTMLLYEQLAYLLGKKEMLLEIRNTQGKKTVQNKLDTKRMSTLQCILRPKESLVLVKNKKRISLGEFSKFENNTQNEWIFYYVNGDSNSFGTRNSAVVVFYPSHVRVTKKVFMDKPGQYKFTVGLPELYTTEKVITLKTVTKEEAERIENMWNKENNVGEQGVTEDGIVHVFNLEENIPSNELPGKDEDKNTGIEETVEKEEKEEKEEEQDVKTDKEQEQEKKSKKKQESEQKPETKTEEYDMTDAL
ncbi:hypothetical protein ECANGB1_1928 [Enterospora canceri]|uniref:Uncharacterized protein n=1 Tax=Enterospora canceri TaxID=1081671 RepID=A0A1Y1S5C3_9MICR|nr:hypothetical protein ECANGB1_1928 [Enterospora canceri]